MEDYKSADVLAKNLYKADSSNPILAVLKTDERVIARVTDGIYRQPGSALRELIANAYDADATHVTVTTDAPRFEIITVEDDGHGMSPDVLAHLIYHIGGSAKRNTEGKKLGITDSEDSTLSPQGRKLIGKIGIGLFSVSHLTNRFQITTKVKGDKFRTIATVVLKRYQDESVLGSEDGKHKFESGKVRLWREKATDIEAHGTSVVLNGIWPTSRDTLRSNEVWSLVDEAEKEGNDDISIDIPKFNIGRIDEDGKLITRQSALPWETSDKPEEAFNKLVESVWGEIGKSSPNPQLDRLFDFYLNMVWDLSLALPLPYFDGHPFDQNGKSWEATYKIPNDSQNSATKITISKSKSLRSSLNLVDDSISKSAFEVTLDNLRLSRPIKFDDFPDISNNAITKPVVGIGKCREEFKGVPIEFSGGPLDFEAYIFWHPKIAPTEHRGSLVRIHGASGTLFDTSFMRYQTAEHIRTGQVTCEIFVHDGLDSALNIDRESFNQAHPHSIFITKWLHNALTKFFSAQKTLGNEIRQKQRETKKEQVRSEIQQLAQDTWVEQSGDDGSTPPEILLVKKGESSDKQLLDSFVFDRDTVIQGEERRPGVSVKAKNIVLEEKIKAIAQVLASFEVLDNLSRSKQRRLLNAIYKILAAAEG